MGVTESVTDTLEWRGFSSALPRPHSQERSEHLELQLYLPSNRYFISSHRSVWETPSPLGKAPARQEESPFTLPGRRSGTTLLGSLAWKLKHLHLTGKHFHPQLCKQHLL